MKIIYKNKKIQDQCINLKTAVKKYGSIVGKRLIDLIVLLEEAVNLLDVYSLPQYRLHALKGDRINQYSIVIYYSSKHRLIIYPLDKAGNILKSMENEKELFINSVMIEVLEVSEHYEK